MHPLMRSTVLALLLAGACARAATPAPESVLAARMGFDRPVIVRDASFRWHWVAACFAMRDSNGDGEISVRQGRHGENFGDELSPYLLFPGRTPESVDDYLASSPDRRFLAAIIRGELWLIDGFDLERWKFSTAEVELPAAGTSGAFQHTVAFSREGRAAFVQRRGRTSELVVVDLPPGQPSPVFRTEDEIARFRFTEEGIQVFTLPPGAADDAIHTTLAPRHCRGSIASYSVFRSKHDPTTRTNIPLPERPPTPMGPEQVLSASGECTPDGSPLLASSTDEYRHLAAGSFQRVNLIELGPLRWTTGEAHRFNCPWDYR
jgi:hypothetical protein